VPARNAEGFGLPPGVLAEIVRQAEAGYPEEVCGLVLGVRGRSESYALRPIPNIAGRERPADPAGQPRGARTAYVMDPVEELRALHEADEHGWAVICIYHSHPDHPPRFSPMDRERAVTAAGEPLWPETCYLIVSVRGGRARDARAFAWDAAARQFAEEAVALPPG